MEYAYDGIGRSTTETWYDDDGDTVADRTVGFTYDSSVAPRAKSRLARDLAGPSVSRHLRRHGASARHAGG